MQENTRGHVWRSLKEFVKIHQEESREEGDRKGELRMIEGCSPRPLRRADKKGEVSPLFPFRQRRRSGQKGKSKLPLLFHST